MKPRFQNIPLDCWLDAKLGVADHSVCFAPHGLPDDDAAANILIEAFDELVAEGPPAQRVLTTIASTHRSRILTLRLVLRDEPAALKQRSITCTGETATFEMTPVSWKIIRDGIEAWRQGAEDFGVDPISSRRDRKHLGDKDRQSAELWFWRYLLP